MAIVLAHRTQFGLPESVDLGLYAADYLRSAERNLSVPIEEVRIYFSPIFNVCLKVPSGQIGSA
jgi:hypothetical protein